MGGSRDAVNCADATRCREGRRRLLPSGAMTSPAAAPTRRPPLAPPDDLTVPSPGSTTLRDVYGRYLSTVLRDLLALPRARVSRAVTLELDRALRVLLDVSRREPAVAPLLIRSPDVSVLVRWASTAAMARTPPDGLEAVLQRVALATLLELARLRVLPAEGVELARPIGELGSLPLGHVLRFDPMPRAVRFLPGALDLDYATHRTTIDLSTLAPQSDAGVTITHPFARIREGLALALVDANPLAMFEAHPDKSGNAIDLGGREVPEWVDALGAAYDVVDQYLPEIAAEMRLMLRQVVPVGYYAEKHLSASYAEAVGTVYLSLHDNLMTMTEALVHEFQHNKLNALLFLDPLLVNADTPLFTSPVRPDPRPLRGVLLAVHAFQPVACLYERMIEAGDARTASPDARRRFLQVVGINRRGCEVLLPNAEPTVIGRGLFDEIARWDAHFDRYTHEDAARAVGADEA